VVLLLNIPFCGAIAGRKNIHPSFIISNFNARQENRTSFKQFQAVTVIKARGKQESMQNNTRIMCNYIPLFGKVLHTFSWNQNKKKFD
jgi:hypothetical protein